MIDLEQKGNGSMESRTVTICSGLDFVNINYTPMIARDPECAKVSQYQLHYTSMIARDPECAKVSQYIYTPMIARDPESAKAIHQ